MASENFADLEAYIKAMHFGKKVVGGVDEADVWKKIEQLNQEYKSVFLVQKARYEALLQERDAEIRRLRGQETAGAGTEAHR